MPPTPALPGISLKDQYLRLGWSPVQGGATEPVEVRGATLSTSTLGAAPERPRAELQPVAFTDAHTLRFTLPFATPVAALDIRPHGLNELVPVRVLGRSDANANAQQAWQPLARAVVYQLQGAPAPQRSALPSPGVRPTRLTSLPSPGTVVMRRPQRGSQPSA